MKADRARAFQAMPWTRVILSAWLRWLMVVAAICIGAAVVQGVTYALTAAAQTHAAGTQNTGTASRGPGG